MCMSEKVCDWLGGHVIMFVREHFVGVAHEEESTCTSVCADGQEVLRGAIGGS